MKEQKTKMELEMKIQKVEREREDLKAKYEGLEEQKKSLTEVLSANREEL